MPDPKKHIDKNHTFVRAHVRRKKRGISKSEGRFLAWVFIVIMVIYLLTRLPHVYLYIGATLLGASLPLYAYWTWKHPTSKKKEIDVEGNSVEPKKADIAQAHSENHHSKPYNHAHGHSHGTKTKHDHRSRGFRKHKR